MKAPIDADGASSFSGSPAEPAARARDMVAAAFRAAFLRVFDGFLLEGRWPKLLINEVNMIIFGFTTGVSGVA